MGDGKRFSCCGIKLIAQEPETDYAEQHKLQIETIDDEYHVFMNHEMKKTHYISFIAYVTSDSVEIKKLYPEQEISVRFRKKGHGIIYAFCNRHALTQTHI